MEELQVGEELLTIQRMAQVSGLSAHTLRYYERVGLMRQRVGRDDANGYRYYTRQDLTWIDFIKHLRATGMPIRDVHHFIDLLRQGDCNISARLQLLKQHRLKIEEHLKEAERHLFAINEKIEHYEQKIQQGVEP